MKAKLFCFTQPSMSSLIFHNNQLLFRNGQLAMNTACCCDSCCCGQSCATKPTLNAHLLGAGLDTNITLNCSGYSPPTPCTSAAVWSATSQLLFNCPDQVRADISFKCEYTGTNDCTAYKLEVKYTNSGCTDISGFRASTSCSCSPFQFTFSIPAPSPNGLGGCNCGVTGQTITVTIT